MLIVIGYIIYKVMTNSLLNSCYSNDGSSMLNDMIYQFLTSTNTVNSHIDSSVNLIDNSYINSHIDSSVSSYINSHIDSSVNPTVNSHINLPNELTTSIGLAGGDFDDVEQHIRTEKRGNNKNNVDIYVQRVRNGIEAYKRNHKLNIPDSEIIFIGQGYGNVVLRMGKSGQLVRVSKDFTSYLHKHYQYVFNILKQYPDNGFFVPDSFVQCPIEDVDTSNAYMYWEIRELKPLERISSTKTYDMLYKCVRFMNKPQIVRYITYSDFKYENIMVDPRNGEYVVADFDFHMSFDFRSSKLNYDSTYRSIDELCEQPEELINQIDRSKYILYNIIPQYLTRFPDGRINWRSLDEERYNPKLLFPCLLARLYMLKSMQDEGKEVDHSIMAVTMDRDIIPLMCTMKSTQAKDVVSFD